MISAMRRLVAFESGAAPGTCSFVAFTGGVTSTAPFATWLRIDCEHTNTASVNMNHNLPQKNERKATLFQTMSVTIAITGWHTIFGSLVSVIHSVASLKF